MSNIRSTATCSPTTTRHLRIVRPFIVSSLLALGACSDPAPACVIAGPPEVQLGTGPEDGVGFVPITEGQTASLTAGAQQGFHIWTNLRARNLCPTHVIITRSGKIADSGVLISRSQDELTLVKAADPTLA